MIRLSKYLILSMFLHFALSGNAQVAKFKAAYIYNFTRFIEWPVSVTTGNFVIGVLGDNEVVQELKTLSATKTVLGKQIEVKELKSATETGFCHVILVGAGQTSKVSAVTGGLGNNATLLISEGSGAIKAGSAINFFMTDNKLQFELKKENILRQGLKMNSQLESLAARKF